jgi:hypothetical protein
MLVHLAAANDEVRKHTEQRNDKDRYDPNGLMDATHVWAAEDVNEDTDRQPDPDEETGEVKHGQDRFT